MTNKTQNTNAHGQSIGEALPEWVPPAPVQCAALTRRLEGEHCSLEILSEAHLPELEGTFSTAPESLWTYLPYGPMQTQEDYQQWLKLLCRDPESQHPYAIRLANGQLAGVAAFLRTNPEAGSIEIGHLCFAPSMQQSRVSTEALYLMIEAVFLLGYRRCEWKCNALNAPSVSAAERLGFRYEGTFRQAQVVKGANRDTAWFSIIDKEWTVLKPCFERWLSNDNFNADGQQLARLSQLVKQARTNLP